MVLNLFFQQMLKGGDPLKKPCGSEPYIPLSFPVSSQDQKRLSDVVSNIDVKKYAEVSRQEIATAQDDLDLLHHLSQYPLYSDRLLPRILENAENVANQCKSQGVLDAISLTTIELVNKCREGGSSGEILKNCIKQVRSESNIYKKNVNASPSYAQCKIPEAVKRQEKGSN
jgi:hypothetical protein